MNGPNKRTAQVAENFRLAVERMEFDVGEKALREEGGEGGQLGVFSFHTATIMKLSRFPANNFSQTKRSSLA